MAEIILNPDVEIKNEEDRKLYWIFRQVVDTKFLRSMNNHLEEQDHCYHNCFNQYVDIRQLSLKEMLDENSKNHSPKQLLEQIHESVTQELTDAITNMIALYREAERRGVKLK